MHPSQPTNHELNCHEFNIYIYTYILAGGSATPLYMQIYALNILYTSKNIVCKKRYEAIKEALCKNYVIEIF